MVNESLIYGLLGIAGVYLAIRLYIIYRNNKMVATSRKMHSIQNELKEVLTNDEYKVKGRFE